MWAFLSKETGAGSGDEDREELTPHFIYSTDIRCAPLCQDPHVQIHWQTPSTVCLVLTDRGDCDDCLPGSETATTHQIQSNSARSSDAGGGPGLGLQF